MRAARLTRTVREGLRDVSVTAPFSLEKFCESVAERRGRPVTVIGVPGIGPGWLGAWVSAREADLIYHPAAVSGLLRDQIVLHHLCHMLLGHRVRPAAGLAAVIAPDVGPQLIGLMLGGGEATPPDAPYADQAEEEQAANAMSSVILARASRSPWPAWPPDATAVPALSDGCRPVSCCGSPPG